MELFSIKIRCTFQLVSTLIEGIEGGFYAAVPADFLQKEIDRIG